MSGKAASATRTNWFLLVVGEVLLLLFFGQERPDLLLLLAPPPLLEVVGVAPPLLPSGDRCGMRSGGWGRGCARVEVGGRRG